MGSNDDDELLARVGRGVGRAREELDRAAQDLARPWPRVGPDVLAEGRAAVGRAAAALQTLADRLDVPPGGGDSPRDSHPLRQ